MPKATKVSKERKAFIKHTNNELQKILFLDKRLKQIEKFYHIRYTLNKKTKSGYYSEKLSDQIPDSKILFYAGPLSRKDVDELRNELTEMNITPNKIYE